MKRFMLFFITNILVVLSISLVTQFFGLNKYMTAYGINYEALIVFCLVWGMAGSVISLLLSKIMAKKAYNLKMIDPYTSNNVERTIYQMVSDLAKRSGMRKTPEVGYYESSEVNAFATGWSERNSLVAVSTGLVNSLDAQAVEAVLAHEIAHIKNGDMVTMTLVQGVVNAFVMFFARILAFFAASLISRNDDDESPSFFLTAILTFVFELLLTFLGSIVVFWFSRHREYKADSGGARLTSKQNMISALSQLSGNKVIKDNYSTMKVNGSGWLELFSTHPSIEKRIKALQNESH